MPSVVQQASGSATSEYGFGTTKISTSDGSWLAVFPGWNCVTAGNHIQVPAVNVTDSAGNLWQQAGISAAGAGGTSPVRGAIWVCPNALPVSWVSVGLTGFAASASWTVAELAGMPQAASLDFSVSVNSAGTAPSLTWIAGEADIGFALVAAGNAGASAGAPAGWTALGTAAAGNADSTGMAVLPYWNPGITAGTATTAVGLGTAASYSYVLCGLSASASPPPQKSQDFPLVVVEAAFGAQPGNVSASADYLFSSDYTTWTDITPRVIGPAVQARISVSAGRQYQLQQEEAGTGKFPLSNVDGAFTPTNPGSPYYSNALNANMSFQSGAAPWTANNGAVLAQSTAYTYATGLSAAAAYSLQVTPDGVTANPGALSELIAVNPNYPYTVSGWFYVPAGWEGGSNGAGVTIDWFNAAQAYLSTSYTTAVPCPAGTWVQALLEDVTPPAGAAWLNMAVQLDGTPSAAVTFYVAEAAVVTGPAPVRTGLVAPLTPVRLSAWWQGRQYPVWAGYAQKWPQEWPGMPQWGFSGLKAADAIAVASAGQMYSALIGEVLIDNPYAYLPCNETYTTAITGATHSNPYVYPGGYYQPTDANGLVAVNRANGNQIPGVYLDGSSQQVSTGLLMDFLGDNGTGMGATGYSGEVTGQRGPSMLYADPGLGAVIASAAGFSIEFWFNWAGTSSQNVALLTAYTTASAFMAPAGSANGASIGLKISGGSLYLVLANAASYLVGTVTPSQAPQHVVLTANTVSGGASVYLNGVPATGFPAPGSAAVRAIVLGPGRYSYDCNNSGTYQGYNYSAGHLAVYAYELPQARIISHYQAGAAGWSGVGAATRFSQIMTWAQLGLKRGGYSQTSAAGTPEVTQIGPAYDLAGQAANSAVYTLSQGEGGRYGTQRNGTLAYLERNSLYNLPVSAILSDGTAPAPAVLNTDPGFATGLAGWTAAGGSVSYPGTRYGALGALSVTGGTVTSPSFTYNGGSAQAGFWVNAASAGTVTCSAVTAASTATAAQAVAGSAWTFIPLTVPASAAVASASLSVSAAGAYSLAWAGVWYSPGNVPYLPKSSYGYDMTYIYDEVTATQQSGASQLVLYDARGTASIARYFRRSALTFQPEVVSAYDVSDLTTWNVNEYQNPYLHVSAVTVDAAPNPLQTFAAILALEQGQVAQVNRHPVGGAPITETGTVERVQHDIGPGFWQASYQLSPYGPAQSVLSADTAGFDSPGSDAALTLAWLGERYFGSGKFFGVRPPFGSCRRMTLRSSRNAFHATISNANCSDSFSRSWMAAAFIMRARKASTGWPPGRSVPSRIRPRNACRASGSMASNSSHAMP